MNLLKVILLTLLISPFAEGQNILLEKDVIGTWTGQVTKFKSKGTKLMFDGSTITINPNYTFTAKVMNGITGDWRLNEGSIILASPDTPEPIILSEISKDSCIWNLDAMDLRITFYKISENNRPSAPTESLKTISVERNNLIGQWSNSLIEDINKTKEENTFLFGSGNIDKLTLYESGQFTLSKSTNNTVTGRITAGTWSLENGVILFESESNKSERLGITKFKQDSLILVNLESRYVPMCGETKIRFTYTKTSTPDQKK